MLLSQYIKQLSRAKAVTRWLSPLSNTLNWLLDPNIYFLLFSQAGHKTPLELEITSNVLVPGRIIKRPFLYWVWSELKYCVTVLIKLLKVFYVIATSFNVSTVMKNRYLYNICSCLFIFACVLFSSLSGNSSMFCSVVSWLSEISCVMLFWVNFFDSWSIIAEQIASFGIALYWENVIRDFQQLKMFFEKLFLLWKQTQLCIFRLSLT